MPATAAVTFYIIGQLINVRHGTRYLWIFFCYCYC